MLNAIISGECAQSMAPAKVLDLQASYRCRLGYGVGRIAQYNKRLPLCSGCLDSKLIYLCKYQKETEHEQISERKTQWGQIPG